jgi:cytochrome c556|tara:strand:+ start:375 stop:821 length:447 start_codon:yes stop_codon:yes gene_type:complete
MKKIFFLILTSLLFFNFNFIAHSSESIEDIIKGRKAIFSANYKTAKRVNALVNDMEFEDAQKFMLEMSENYETLLKYFPENSKEGFGTEALPSIWENKDEFNNLMQKSADDMKKLAAVIEDAEDLRGEMQKFMWSNCKACHSKFRAPH